MLKFSKDYLSMTVIDTLPTHPPTILQLNFLLKPVQADCASCQILKYVQGIHGVIECCPEPPLVWAASFFPVSLANPEN